MELNASLLVSAVIILTLVTHIYLYCRSKLSYWTKRGVPQLTTSHWLFGDFKEGILFQTSPGCHLANIYKKGYQKVPFIGFYIFHKPCLLVRDPEIIKQIFVRDFDNFADRHFAGSTEKDSIGMKNLFGLRNPAWRYLRQKITPTLTKEKLKQLLPMMMKTGETMMQYIKKKEKLDVEELNYKYTTDLIANAGLGLNVDSFNNPNGKFTQTVAGFFRGFKRMVALVSVFFVPELVNMVGSSIFLNLNYVEKIFWSVLEDREKSGEKRGDYLDTIIKLKNGPQNSLYEFSGDNLFYQIGTFFSGFESSSIAASFTLLELSKHQDYQQLARDDIRRAVEIHGWTYEGFKAMRFVTQCMQEGMRMHPPVMTLDRQAKEDYTIPGTKVTIDKGTAVYVSLFGLQGDPDFFDHPEIFNPYRFTSDSMVQDVFMPFGVGPRMCLGMKAGELHVKVVVALIVSQYQIHPTRGDKPSLDPKSTFTAAAEGIHMEFRKLENPIKITNEL